MDRTALALALAGLLAGCAAESEDEATGTTDPTANPSDTADPTTTEDDDGGSESSEGEGSGSGGNAWDGERVTLVDPECTSAVWPGTSTPTRTCDDVCGDEAQCVTARWMFADTKACGSDTGWSDRTCSNTASEAGIIECTCAHDDPTGEIAVSDCIGPDTQFFDDYTGSCDDWCDENGLGACRWVEEYRPGGACETYVRVTTDNAKPSDEDGPPRFKFACDIE